jgi:hypothetical protein
MAVSASEQQNRHHCHAQARDRLLEVAGAINRRNKQVGGWQVTGMKPKWIGNLIPGGVQPINRHKYLFVGGVDA